MEQIIFYIIVAIIVVDFIAQRWLDILNTFNKVRPLPAEVENYYDEKRYLKAQHYKRANDRMGLLGSSLSFAAILVLLLSGGFGWLDSFWRQYTDHEILLSLLFLGSLALVSQILGLPLALYRTFNIEERFGFNRTTPATFFTDMLKGWVLAIILGGGLISVIIWLYQIAGSYFWVIAWLVITMVMIFLNMFYSSLIVPLFNKQTPLEDGPLREKIQKFAQDQGFKLDNIFVIDGSKRSAKSNAYFSGLGPRKRIVLFDTLIDRHSDEELVAVLAHEIGHYKKKHILIHTGTGIIQTGIFLFAFQQFLEYPAFSRALGADQASFHMGMLAFGLLITPVNFLLTVLGNILSRKFEYQADAFAANTYSANALGMALKKLAAHNLSNLYPHPAYVKAYYSHPPILKRLQFLKKQGNISMQEPSKPKKND